MGAQMFFFSESGRGLGHVTPTIFGSTVGYPSDSLASCLLSVDTQTTTAILSSEICLESLNLNVFSPIAELQCLHFYRHFDGNIDGDSLYDHNEVTESMLYKYVRTQCHIVTSVSKFFNIAVN